MQRVSRAGVRVMDRAVAEIGPGLLILLGIGHGDGVEDVDYLVKKTAHLRIFSDQAGQMNRSLMEVGGECLVVSQFTLYGDCRKGRRPSFVAAADPGVAEPLYQQFIAALAREGVPVKSGIFRADMQVDLVNDGPVTLLLESRPSVELQRIE